MFVRIADIDDLDALLALARRGGSGLTNLPADRAALAARLHASTGALADDAAPGPIILVLCTDDHVVGCGMVFPLVDPDFQGRGAGALMARSRYLFIACHRERFGTHIIADLRGRQVDGGSPFWDAVGRHFYDMPFEEADRLNAMTGNQMIADLGPRHPIHVALLNAEAQAVIGEPHHDGQRARDLLLAEGFREDGYIDIFDAGPTLVGEIDTLASIRTSLASRVDAIESTGADAEEHLIAAHAGAGFRVARAAVRQARSGIAIAPEAARTLNLTRGDPVRHVRF